MRTFVDCFLAILLVTSPSLLILRAESPPDYRFKAEVLATDFPQPMELEVAPDGRVFLNELSGKLKIYKPQSGEVVVAGEIPVFASQENGFLGFALDPHFAANHWIYIFYSPTNIVGQRLSRFVMRGDTLDRSTEKTVLEFGTQRRECCHHAGSVEFGPDGNLFISTGDNTHPGGDSDGYAPIDERPDREPYDAQKSASNTHDLRGKILRIRPRMEGGYTIPDGNLFPKDGSQGRPEIFVMGCRNPWRMSVDQRSGYVYWGEVGPDAWGDGPRGSRGYDEINQARRAGNFGWPYFVGNNSPYYDYDFDAKKIGARFDPARPINESPNNTGAKILPPAQPAFIYWPYGDSSEFPMLGSGGRTACAGPVFYFNENFKNSGGFPEHYDRCLLFYDWQRPFMKWARLDTDSNLKSIEPFPEVITVLNDKDRVAKARAKGKFVVQRPVDSQFGPDGCLYLLDFGETWGPNKDSQLIKISYQWGNLAPLARASADQTTGPEPLQIQLSSAGSVDYENDPLQFEWSLHPGGKIFSEEANPRLSLEKPGNYIVNLRVSDRKGGNSNSSIPVTVGNSIPKLTFLEPREGEFIPENHPIKYRLRVDDREEGNSEAADEFFEGQTIVNVTWSRGDGAETAVDPGLALMKQSDCFNCHALEQKVVGPPLVEIAQKYRGQAEAFETSVQRVIKGSTGAWSEVPMLPHEGLHPDQVRLMVQWIYGLEPGKTTGDVIKGLAGEILPPKDAAFGRVTLEASYTDAGRPPANPLTGRTFASLRPRRVQAEFADEKHGLRVLGNFLGAIDHGHYARIDSLHLQEIGNVTLRVASAGHGGHIQLRVGAVDGPLLAEVKVPVTGGWENWVELNVPISRTDHADSVYIVFINPGKQGLMNLDWIEFHERENAAHR